VTQPFVSARARRDLSEIHDYLFQRNERAADRVLARIEEHIGVLGNNPRLGLERDELRPGLRCFTVGNYVIYFHLISDGAEIVRVLHGAPDIDAIFKR
jgi:toxin ParE1/3/4